MCIETAFLIYHIGDNFLNTRDYVNNNRYTHKI